MKHPPDPVAVRALQGMLRDALRHYQAGQLTEAEGICQRILALDARNATCLNLLGIVFEAQSKLEEAAICFERALALKPDLAEVNINLGNIRLAQGKAAEAVAYQGRALALKPECAEAFCNLGNARQSRGEMDEAVICYERALALKPDYAAAHNNLGNAFKAQGRFNDALAHYGQAIAIRPDYAEAHFHRSGIKSFHHGDADLAALEALAASDKVSANKAVYIHFALAKALEDTGDYTRAWEHLRKGNALKRGQIHYDEAAVIALFERISRVFDRSLFERFRGEGDSSSVPVFVLGMPRSGSTLIEQILASHPQIHAAGELPHLETAAGVLSGGDPPVPYPECVPALDGAALRRLAQAYLAQLPHLADGRVRTIDKLPGNFLHIGLIHLILPNAKIIHTMRHPIDTCVSCYSNLFTSGLFFTYDLSELGRYYRCYRELMAHWRSVLPPGVMLEVSYEDVIDDLETQARRLVDYCGLTWDDRCLSFHRSGRAIRTASAVQVRQPLFRGSLERWRKYEAGLTPLLMELLRTNPALET